MTLTRAKKNGIRILVISVLSLFALQAFVGSFGLVGSAAATSGNVTKITLTDYNGQDSAGLADLQAGKIASYDFELTPTETSQLNSSMATMSVPADVYDLILNPQNTTWGFNPFYYTGVRQAMNYVVDRSYFINNLLGGAGIPGISMYAGEPDQLIVSNVTAKYASYNNYSIAQANATIQAALKGSGATYSAGKWSYKGNPVTIYLFDRTDDPIRHAYAGFLQTQLQNLGFTVSLIQGDLSKEISLVYSSDPANTTWSILPESWSGAYSYYDESLAADFTGTLVAYPPYSDSYGLSMNTFNDSKTQSPELTTLGNQADQIIQKLITGNFSTMTERSQLLQNLTNLSFQTSTRIWLGTSLNVYAYNPKLVNNLSPSFTYSPVLNPMSYITMTSPTGSVDIGVRHLASGSMNPVAGFSDAYSADLSQGVVLPLALDQGSTGYPYLLGINDQVVGWNYNASTPVPSNAITYNATTGQFVPVANGSMARTVAIANFAPLMSNDKWSDGQPITLADFLYQYVIAENVTFNTKSPIYDSTAATDYAPGLSTVLGFRILNATSVEIYSSFYYPDKTYAGVTVATSMFPLGFAVPLPGAFPWQLYQAMANVVASGKAAWSSTTANTNKVNWLNLVNTQDVSNINSALSTYASSSYIPPQLSQLQTLSGVSLVSSSDAQSGYSAASSFITTNGNAVISDGPFYISQYQTTTTPNFAILSKNTNFQASGIVPPAMFAQPSAITTQPTNIPSVAAAGSSITVTAISTPIGSKTGTPQSGVTVVVQLLSSNAVVFQTSTITGANGQATVKLPSNIAPGTYTIQVFSSSSNSTLLQPITQTITITSGSATGTGTTLSQTTTTGTSTGTSTSSTTNNTATLELVAGIVVVIIIIVGVIFAMRRRGPATPPSPPSA